MQNSRRNFFLGGLAAAGALRAQVTDQVAAHPAATTRLDIFQAAAAGDIPRATELADADPEIVRRPTADGRTPLHFATANGKPEMVLFLQLRGAELSAGPESPLLAAVDYPDHDVATAMSQPLLMNASNPNAARHGADGAGKSALHLAAARGYADLAELLIHRGARVTPRETAAATGEAIQVLRNASKIEQVHYNRRYIQDAQGQPVTRDDTNGVPWTQVNQFVRLAHADLEKVKQLCQDTPALLNTRASWDELAVEAGAHVGRVPIASWLADRGAAISTCTAVLLGMAEKVKEAIAADPLCLHERGAHDIAILSYTAWGNPQTAIAEQLLKAGANVDTRSFNMTTLHLAASKGYTDLAALLLEHGADINATYQLKGVATTPLAAAIKAKQEKMEQFLRERGARA
ncbi:MAG TPA: ankyrin repeat domain-containing protein [Candidatus Acidoferrales bacterium]|jgi:ankyrin repeat protein|nr:ankyrin repeat domain-containing protein [Candidatus Acidoferrales bacterium]